MSISIAILSGGKSRRMGQDKGFVSFKGIPMIQHALNTVDEFDLPITIIANSDDYKALGYPVLEDEIKDKGPLGGLYTALLHASTDKVLFLPCDSPFIDRVAIERLIANSKDEAATLATQDGAIHPLFAIYSKKITNDIKSEIETGNLKVIDAIKDYKKVNYDDMDKMLFANLNTMEDLITWQQ